MKLHYHSNLNCLLPVETIEPSRAECPERLANNGWSGLMAEQFLSLKLIEKSCCDLNVRFWESEAVP